MRTTVAPGLTEPRQIPVSGNGDLRVRRARDSFYGDNRCLWLDPCRPHCSVAWRRQWLA